VIRLQGSEKQPGAPGLDSQTWESTNLDPHQT